MVKRTVISRSRGEAFIIGDTLVRVIGSKTTIVVEHRDDLACDREEVSLARAKGITTNEAKQQIRGAR